MKMKIRKPNNTLTPIQLTQNYMMTYQSHGIMQLVNRPVTRA